MDDSRMSSSISSSTSNSKGAKRLAVCSSVFLSQYSSHTACAYLVAPPRNSKTANAPTHDNMNKEAGTGIRSTNVLPYPFNGKDAQSWSFADDHDHNAHNRKRKQNKDTTKCGTLTVPSVGVGTISWSSNKLTSLENPELEKLVNKACESDVAFFDTAERYGSHIKAAMGMGWGETEQMTREFLSRQVQDQDANAETGASNAIVATKFTPTPWRTSVESVVKACEDSCQRLGVSSIPLYQLHMPDIVQPAARLWGNKGRNEKDQIYWEGLAECYDRGLVQNVGVCNYGPTLLEECQEALAKRGVPLVSNQIAYSLIGRHNGSQETLDKGNSLGIQTIAYFPFAMGLLTGKYSSKDAGEHVASTRDNNRSNSLWTSEKSKLEAKDLNLYLSGDGKRIPKGGVSPLLKVMEQIALTRKKTVAQVALNYIICKGAIPIPGARTAAQLEDNMGALGWRLSSTEIQLLESEADRLGFGFEGAGFKRTSEKFVGYGVEKWTLT